MDTSFSFLCIGQIIIVEHAMSACDFIKHGEIVDSQYTVSIHLKNLFKLGETENFVSDLTELKKTCGEDIDGFCKLDDYNLEYRSETILPTDTDGQKRKVLIVFGNPAIHSVKNGMFFFSRAKNRRHDIWGKLKKSRVDETGGKFKCKSLIGKKI